MKSEIAGTTMPVLTISLERGEKLISEPGHFAWMSPNIQLTTSAKTAGVQSTFGVLGRAISGGGLFMNEYQALNAPGNVAFAAKIPGNIVEVQIQPGQDYMVHRHGFLCGTEGIELSTGFQRSIGAGIFGGTGIILQRLAGHATAWIELGGEIVSRKLAHGESLNVHPGHVGMFESSVKFDIVKVPGIKNILFGSDGLFLARLTGPGQIWLQTLTLPTLAHALSPYLYMEEKKKDVNLALFGAAASVLKSVLK